MKCSTTLFLTIVSLISCTKAETLNSEKRSLRGTAAVHDGKPTENIDDESTRRNDDRNLGIDDILTIFDGITNPPFHIRNTHSQKLIGANPSRQPQVFTQSQPSSNSQFRFRGNFVINGRPAFNIYHAASEQYVSHNGSNGRLELTGSDDRLWYYVQVNCDATIPDAGNGDCFYLESIATGGRLFSNSDGRFGAYNDGNLYQDAIWRTFVQRVSN